MANIGEFQDMVYSSISLASTCFCYSCSSACIYSDVKAHFSTHTDLSGYHFKGRVHFVLLEIKCQSQETEHLPNKETNLDVKILVKLLHLVLCLPNPQFQYHLYLFLALVSDH